MVNLPEAIRGGKRQQDRRLVREILWNDIDATLMQLRGGEQPEVPQAQESFIARLLDRIHFLERRERPIFPFNMRRGKGSQGEHTLPTSRPRKIGTWHDIDATMKSLREQAS